MKALNSIRRSAICLLLIDAAQGVTDQDQKLAAEIFEMKRACIVVINKWDLIAKDNKTHEAYLRTVYEKLPFLDFAPSLCVSALTGLRVRKVLDLLEAVEKTYEQSINTGEFNRMLKSVVERNPMPRYRGRNIKIYYGTQVGTAPPSFALFTNAPKEVPEHVLMDIAMPDLNGIEATQQISEECPATKTIILSMFSTTQHISRAFKAGARGYILKESAGDNLIKAVRMVYGGKIFLCEEISEVVVGDYVRKHETAEVVEPLDRLTSREREILQLLVEGKTNRRIAEILFLSPKTIETYRSRLMQKLGIKDMPGLVKFAIQCGITSVE